MADGRLHMNRGEGGKGGRGGQGGGPEGWGDSVCSRRGGGGGGGSIVQLAAAATLHRMTSTPVAPLPGTQRLRLPPQHSPPLQHARSAPQRPTELEWPWTPAPPPIVAATLTVKELDCWVARVRSSPHPWDAPRGPICERGCNIAPRRRERLGWRVLRARRARDGVGCACSVKKE